MPNGHDKNWIRLCAAIDGFRVRHGTWPIRVRLFRPSLDDLQNHLFTPEAFARITSKVALVADEASMVAEDDSGHSYDYGKEGFPATRPETRATDWLGVRPKTEEDYGDESK